MNTSELLNAQAIEQPISTPHEEFWETPFGEACKDIIDGVKQHHLWTYMAVSEIRRRYRRTVLGPFWTTLSLAIFIGSMSVLFSYLWKTDIPSFLPFFASGFICWVFVSTVIVESCTVFVSAEGLLKQIPLPYSTFSWLVISRNLLIMAHHSIVYFFIVLVLKVPVNLNTLLFIPGIILVCLTGFWVSILVGLLCSRYRDLQQVVNSLLQISMFVTPIFWPPSQLGGGMRAVVLLDANPLYHYVSIVRLPLLGQAPEFHSWIITAIITLVVGILAFLLFAKYRRKLIFWI